MNRSKASSIRRQLQLASLGLGGVVALAATVPLTAKQPDAAEIRKQAIASATAQPTNRPTSAPVDVNPATMAAGLLTISPPPKIIAKAPETNDEGQPNAQTPAAPPPAAWRYLGAIESGDYRRAIVLVDGKQHMLAERQKLNDIELLEITADSIRVMKPAPENEVVIEKAKRERTRLSLVTPTRSTPAASGGGGTATASQAALEARMEALRREGGKTAEAEMRAIKMQLNKGGLRNASRNEAAKASTKTEEFTLQGGDAAVESKEGSEKSEGGK
jgi:hypothetical protein